MQGVVTGAGGAPVTLRDVVVPAPGPGEVRVRVRACGLCHTDLHHRGGVVEAAFERMLAGSVLRAVVVL